MITYWKRRQAKKRLKQVLEKHQQEVRTVERVDREIEETLNQINDYAKKRSVAELQNVLQELVDNKQLLRRVREAIKKEKQNISPKNDVEALMKQKEELPVYEKMSEKLTNETESLQKMIRYMKHSRKIANDTLYDVQTKK